MDRRESQLSSESLLKKKLVRRKKPLTIRRKCHRKLKQTQLKRLAAEVVDIEPEQVIEKLKGYDSKEAEVMRYYIEKKCEICLTAQSENNMVLCDRCDDAYHIHCLDPPLDRIPTEIWLCSSCRHEIEQDSHNDRDFPRECHRCRQALTREKFIFFKDFDPQHMEEFQLNLQKRNLGFPCRHCNHYFHFSCLNERVNSINCTECQRTLRSNGPKSQAQYAEFIRKAQEYDATFFRKYELMPRLPHPSGEATDEGRLPPLGLRLPRQMTNPYTIIKASLSLYYALATQRIRFIDQQVYCLGNARVGDNNVDTSNSRFKQLSLKDEGIFEQFKKLSQRGFFGPLEVVENKTRGFFVKALQFIHMGTIITEYVGEVVTARKSLQWKANDSIFSLVRTSHSRTSLDICPTGFSNISKFICGINNSNRRAHWLQNVQTMKFKYQGRARVIFYAKRHIQPGDTLFMDYNAGGFDEYPTENFS